MNKIFLVLFLVFLSHSIYSQEYYVSTRGNDKNDGKSEAKAWRTISYAATKVGSGDVVWIKAGNYGDENVVITNSGKKGAPISFIGYKNKIGDVKSTYFKYKRGWKFDDREMPLLDGKNRANGEMAFTIDKTEYVVLKNIQIQNYRWGVHGGVASNAVLERILAGSFGNTRDKGESGYGFEFKNGGNNEFIDCVVINATGANLRVEGDRNLIDKVKSYCDDNSTGEISATDYYIHINGGNNNIIRNSYIERVGNLEHTGHGFGLKYDCRNNLIENCESVNVKGAIEFRHSGVRNNTARNVVITGPMGSINLRDGASDNIIENCLVSDTNEGIRFYDQTEAGQGGVLASGNVIKNSIFHNIGTFIVSTKAGNVSREGFVSGNTVINCTLDDANNLFETQLPMHSSNEIINTIICNVKGYEDKQSKYNSAWSLSYSNFHKNSFKTPKGSGNMSEDSDFENSGKGDYRLKSTSPLIDAGKTDKTVKKDFDGLDRPMGSSHDIGAHEYQKGSTGTGSIKADAGEDEIICKGEKVVLTASGGKKYEWSNGEKSESITVSPTKTTTYEVTVSDGKKKDTDKVTVEVISVSADAGKDVSIEEGESITLTASGGDSYEWSTGETTQSITVSPKESKTYTVTAIKDGCEDSDKVRVDVTAVATAPVVANAGKDVIICKGEEIVLTASGGKKYEWSNGEKSESITVSPTKTTTYEVTVSDGNKKDTDKVTVEVISVSADAGEDVSIEEGESITLTASGGDSYEWSNGETTQSITVSPKDSRSYTVKAIVGSCEDSDLVRVEVKAKSVAPVVANAGKDVSICSGESVKLTATGGSDYSWDNGMTGQTIEVSPEKTTTYEVTVSDGHTTATDKVTVTVNSVQANAGKDVSIEEGESITLTASGGDSFEWSNGETTKSITVSPEESKTYTVTAIKDGCEDTDKVRVQVVKNAAIAVEANAGEDVSICNGESVKLTASGGSEYSWDNGMTGQSIKVSPKKTTTYEVTVTDGVTSSTDEVTVHVNTIQANAGKDVTIEAGSSVTLTASGGDTFSWNTGETTKSIKVAPSKTTTYSVKVFRDGCEDADQVIVKVIEKPATPVIAFAGDDVSICSGESVKLTATGGSDYSWDNGMTGQTIEVSPEKTTTYEVSVSDSHTTATDKVTVYVNSVQANAGKDVSIEEGESITLTASGGDSYEWNNGETTQSITVSPEESKTYTVTAIKDGCEDTDKVRVQVVKNAAIAVEANAGEDVSICNGESVKLTATGGSEYSWDNGMTGQSIKVSPKKTTTYEVTVTDGVTSSTDEVTVHVNTIQANAGKDVTIEAGSSVTLTASGGDTFSWNTGETTKSIKVAPSKTTTYSVKVFRDGCEDADQVIVVVKDAIDPNAVSAGDDVTICKGESVQLSADGSGVFSWDNGMSGQTIEVSPQKTTTYEVTATDENQSISDKVTVYVNTIQISAGSGATIEEGDTITLTATGGDSYEWSTGESGSSITVSPMETRIYSVVGYIDGCMAEDKIQVTVNKTEEQEEENIVDQEGDGQNEEAPIANAGEDIVICVGEKATLQGSGQGNFKWSTGDISASVTVSPKRTTTYTLEANRGDTIAVDTVVVYVEQCEQEVFSDNNEVVDFTVYPNPSHGIVNMNVTADVDLKLAVFDLNGRVLHVEKLDLKYSGSFNKQLDLSRFAKGMYLLKLYNGTTNLTKKIILI